jgi:hypothetical protein
MFLPDSANFLVILLKVQKTGELKSFAPIG